MWLISWSACSCTRSAESCAAKLELSVNDPRYGAAVAAAFGTACCYCGRALENDRAAVEHLDGMNRFRVGLHVPGNVIVACTRCNREKRRDDSAPKLTLAESGWESFLSHDSETAAMAATHAGYWSIVWPEASERISKLQAARDRIRAFRANYAPYLEMNARARVVLAAKMDAIYRDCQEFATTRIKEAVEDVLRDLVPAEPVGT